MRFGISNNVRSRVVRECTPELFYGAMDAPIVKMVCAEIADAREMVARGVMQKEEFEAKKAELKKRLPILTPHATFKNGRRLGADAVPSGLSMFDIDHIPDPRGRWAEIEPRKEQLGILLAHVTPSMEGLRLFFVIPQGMDLAEAQAWMAHQLGDEKYDTCTKDYARSSFVVPRGYLLWVSERLFEPCATDGTQMTQMGRMTTDKSLPCGLCHPERSEGSQGIAKEAVGKTQRSFDSASSAQDDKCVGGRQDESEPCGAENSSSASEKSRRKYPTDYRGIPYTTILQAIAEELGGEPTEGERNAKVLRMASSLRHICDNNPEWLMEIIPTYGLPVEEWKKTIQNASKDGLKYGTTKVLERSLSLALSRREGTKNAGASISLTRSGEVGGGLGGGSGSACPPLPANLPPLIALLVKNVPEGMKPAVAHAVFPPLGAHLGGVKFRYIDNVEREATFMCVLLAKMSSGKSAVNKPIQLIMKDIVERDSLNRQREQEWKASLSTKGANKEKPKRPDGLCIQMLVPDMTNAAFVQRLADAQGKFLYTQMDELELLNNLKTSNRSNQVSQIIRLAFDQGLYGQERVGAASVTAMVPIRWNWNASATIERGRQFFRTALTDGTLSRLNFCTIPPQRMGEIPVYGTYDAEYEAELRPYIDRLNAATGLIECPKAEALARKLLQESAEVVMLTDDEVYEMLSHRANVIAYLKAMTLYIAHGCKWSKQIEEFVRWSKEYDLWCKMYFFGKRMQEEVEKEIIRTSPGRANMLEMLPERFTRQQLEEVRVRLGKERDAFPQLRQWKKRGYIVQDDPMEEHYAKSVKYLSKYGA